MKILILILIFLLMVVPPVITGAAKIPTDLNGFIGFIVSIMNWWLTVLRLFLRIIITYFSSFLKL